MTVYVMFRTMYGQCDRMIHVFAHEEHAKRYIEGTDTQNNCGYYYTPMKVILQIIQII